MVANKESLSPKYARAVALKAEGKSFKEIGKIMGCAENTAWRWFYKGIEEDGSIKDVIDELKFTCLDIAVQGKKQLRRYVKQVDDAKHVGTDEAKALEKISENNMKGYSSLQGALTDDKGGEVSPETRSAVGALLDRIL